MRCIGSFKVLFYPEDRGSKFLRNADDFQLDYTVSQPTIFIFTATRSSSLKPQADSCGRPKKFIRERYSMKLIHF
jgi:hypothetical protein